MNDAIIGGWILGGITTAVFLAWAGRLLLIWAFNRISDYIEHQLAQALSRPLYGNHTTLDQEYRDLITKEHGHD